MGHYRIFNTLRLMTAIRAGLCWSAVALLLVSWSVPALAQKAPPAQKEAPTQVRELNDLLADPAVRKLLALLTDPGVRDWLQQYAAAQAAGPAAAPETTTWVDIANRMGTLRQHLQTLAAAVPTVPAELERASTILSTELEKTGLGSVLLLIAAFVALGFGIELLFRRITRGLHTWLAHVPLDTVGERLGAVVIRLAFGLGLVMSFAVGSVGAFLLLDWPLLLREIVLRYLVAFLITRLALALTRFLLAPGGPQFRLIGGERFRIIPMSTAAAWFWHRRIGFVVGWLAVGWVTVGQLGALGVAEPARQLVAYALGLVLLAIGLEVAWRRPREDDGAERLLRRVSHWLLSAYVVLLWLLWVASAMPEFWVAVVALALPAAVRTTERSVCHILRPAGDVEAGRATKGLHMVGVEHAVRAVLIVGFALLLVRGLQLDLNELMARDTLLAHVFRGVLGAIIVALVADVLWQSAKALIDRTIAQVQDPGEPDTDEARHRARLRTLLPILRNVLFIVVVVMAVLMVLTAMGVQIGPLIAGAGVVGVAVGFGAQTLIKDVISGVFYLLDDAFRIGEYIQSGNYKGTVESFSLRSVKLRHHRGPLYTVPFGSLGAIRNESRDWVIDKLSVGVTYDTDLDKARKLIKQVGKDLAADPEFAPHILEPMKMQGVEEFGDYAIQLRMKMMTKPGEQFVIRRKAYALIKKTFDANGIKFAYPTVQVAGGDEATAAAARQALAKTQIAAE
jgi:small-conductance mechanosensitive channel